MNYTAKDIADFFHKQEHLVTHHAVLQTKFRIANCSTRKIELMANQAKQDLRYALNCFAKSLYPNHTNCVVRKPNVYRPLSLVTVENINETTDNQQTIHFNISFGNFPKHLNTIELEILLRHAWHIKAKQQNDIYLVHKQDYPANHYRWNCYITKDANKNNSLAWTTTGTWDVTNCWIPHAAANAD